MRFILFIFVFLFFPCYTFSAAESELLQGGIWDCSINGEQGTGHLVLDKEKKVFQVALPEGKDTISFPYEIIKNDGKTAMLSLTTPDKQSHYIELDSLSEDRMAVRFVNEKDAPLLQCARKEKGTSIGH